MAALLVVIAVVAAVIVVNGKSGNAYDDDKHPYSKVNANFPMRQ